MIDSFLADILALYKDYQAHYLADRDREVSADARDLTWCSR